MRKTAISTALMVLLVVSMVLIHRTDTAAAVPVHITIVVTSNNTRGWTDTGLTVEVGDRVDISAAGCWTSNYLVGPWDPDGHPNTKTAMDNWYSDANNAELIAYVSATPPPFPGGHSPSAAQPPFYAVGKGPWTHTFTTGESGELWLGMNDDAVTGTYDDNAGNVTADITVNGLVGWEAHPINKVRVLLPWIALAVILAGGMGWYILRRRMVQS